MQEIPWFEQTCGLSATPCLRQAWSKDLKKSGTPTFLRIFTTPPPLVLEGTLLTQRESLLNFKWLPMITRVNVPAVYTAIPTGTKNLKKVITIMAQTFLWSTHFAMARAIKFMMQWIARPPRIIQKQIAHRISVDKGRSPVDSLKEHKHTIVWIDSKTCKSTWRLSLKNNCLDLSTLDFSQKTPIFRERIQCPMIVLEVWHDNS